MDELVQMLSNKEHNAEVLHSKNSSEVKEQVDRKWINMKFTDIGTSIICLVLARFVGLVFGINKRNLFNHCPPRN